MLNISHEKLNRFNQLINSIDAFYHRMALKAGLSDSAFWILYMVRTLGSGCIQKDISEAIVISKKTINSAIWKLEQKGFLRLERGKRRDMHIFLTEKGEEFVEKHVTPIIAAEEHSFYTLEEKEQEELIRITEKYYRNIQYIAEKNTENNIETDQS